MLDIVNPDDSNNSYSTTIAGASHWSLVVRRGISLRITDINGWANVGMLLFNPHMLSEKYNAPDTLKCQHTYKLTQGHCLYSDMGRIFGSIVDDSFGWHDTLCGNTHAEHIAARWGARNYQDDRNAWHQNGYDSFLVELAKYNLTRRDMAANINWFSAVSADAEGKLQLINQSQAGANVTLRFEMDTLVLLHTCPHPLNRATSYPFTPVKLELFHSPKMLANDRCLNACDENRRGFENNALYHFGKPG